MKKRKFLMVSGLLALGLTSTGIPAESKKRSVLLSELNADYEVIGRLGQPIYTVHKFAGRVIDGSVSHAKGDDGQVYLEVSHVDEKPMKKPVWIDFDAFNPNTVKMTNGTRIPIRGDKRRKLIGQNLNAIGYESVHGTGVPAEAWTYVPAEATTGPYLSSSLVILKILK
jgi:hypothetical protein